MIILRWVLNALILIAIANITPGVSFSGIWAALVTSLILGLLNAVVRPLLILLTLPVNFLTLGLFTFVINAFVFWLASTIVKGFDITNFGSAIIAAILYWIVTTAINYFIDKPKIIRVR